MERTDPALLGQREAPRRHALVVDDDAVGRIALKKLLANCGYDATVAVNGEDGVRAFGERMPDVVFMDMMMPVMDGLAATLRIKQLCGDRFVPVIFITGASDDEDIARCIEAGGDDFITKPYSGTVLAAKVRAMERIRELHRRTHALHSQLQEEQALAKRILEGAVMGPNAVPPGVAVHLAPAATFNGDILLAAHEPGGDLYLLLGDFTGHGLGATIGALPTAETFRAMANKGFEPAAILSEINRKLRTLLPTGMFLAAVFLRISRLRHDVAVINCGMPDVLLVNGDTVEVSVSSRALPLAVIADEDFGAAEVRLAHARNCRIVLVSDGALEAMNAAGEMFGSERLHAVLAGSAGKTTAIPRIAAAIESFRNGVPAADDISLVEIVLSNRLFGQPAPATDREAAPAADAVPEPQADAGSGWRLQLELRGQALRTVSPLPILMSLLREFPEVSPHCPSLFTVLAELYNNALDHGVLGLDSSLKEQDFATYLHERDARLAGQDAGRVRIGIDCGAQPDSQDLTIDIEDSGTGFDPAAASPAAEDAPYGRGLHLVRSLCRSLEHTGTGNRAVARYDLDRSAGDDDAHPGHR